MLDMVDDPPDCISLPYLQFMSHGCTFFLCCSALFCGSRQDCGCIILAVSLFHASIPLSPLLQLFSSTVQGNYYGTPKPPAEPNLVQPDLVDQVLFDEDYGGEVPRKRTTSVSKMDRKDSMVPEEEDDDERPPLVNGLPGQ